MESTTTETTTTNETQTGMPWAEAIQASAEAQATPPSLPPNSRRITDVLHVPVTAGMLAKIAIDNADDDSAMGELQEEVDDLKEKLKGKKGELDVIAKRMSERHEAVRSGTQTLKGEWILTDVFERNAVEYRDPVTGALVLERAMSASERQQELPLGNTDSSSTDATDDDGEAPDSEPSVAGTVISGIDPEALLNEATGAGDDA